MKSQLLYITWFFLILRICLITASAQTNGAASSYNAEGALIRANVLKENPKEENNPSELERLCNQALAHQDVKTLSVLVCTRPYNLQMRVLDGLSTLPPPAQKQILVAVLRDDGLWNYDRIHGVTGSVFSQGQIELQGKVRITLSRVLGKELYKASKYYNPDRKKQYLAEVSSTEASIIDPATREHLVAELTAK